MDRITQFIDETVGAMLENPGFWGGLSSVELQVVRLLEVRALARDKDTSYEAAASVHDRYVRYLGERFSDQPSCLLSDLVKGNLEAFKSTLAAFRDEVVEEQDAPVMALQEDAPVTSLEGFLNRRSSPLNVTPRGTASSDEVRDAL